jgi:hypothetical protein
MEISGRCSRLSNTSCVILIQHLPGASLLMVENGHAFVKVDSDKKRLLFSYKSGAPPTNYNLLSPKQKKAWYDSCKKATFDLVQLLGNHNGHLRWGGVKCGLTDTGARNWSMNETRLLVELEADKGKWRWDGIDLSSRFKVGNGGQILALTHFVFENDGMILATGRPVTKSG